VCDVPFSRSRMTSSAFEKSCAKSPRACSFSQSSATGEESGTLRRNLSQSSILDVSFREALGVAMYGGGEVDFRLAETHLALAGGTGRGVASTWFRII